MLAYCFRIAGHIVLTVNNYVFPSHWGLLIWVSDDYMYRCWFLDLTFVSWLMFPLWIFGKCKDCVFPVFLVCSNSVFTGNLGYQEVPVEVGGYFPVWLSWIVPVDICWC